MDRLENCLPDYRPPRFEVLRRTLTGWECDAYYIASHLAMALGFQSLGDRLGQRSMRIYRFLRAGFVR